MSPKNQKVIDAIGTAFYQRPFTEIYDLLARAAVCKFRRLLVRQSRPFWVWRTSRIRASPIQPT